MFSAMLCDYNIYIIYIYVYIYVCIYIYIYIGAMTWCSCIMKLSIFFVEEGKEDLRALLIDTKV
jgi:hypothetical protein